MDKRYINISKAVSYALRHNPSAFGLELDSEGWVSIGDLINALNKENSHLDVTVASLCYIIDNSEKKRFEIKDNKIRATYGHSIEQKIEYTPQVPPPVLYHGTSHNAMVRIIWEGLKPMSRQYVHLSSDIATAQKVGKRHDNCPVILKIDAIRMYNDGFKFYHTGNDTTWLCESVPFKYICPPPMNEVLR